MGNKVSHGIQIAVFIILSVFLMASEGWGATYYVDPTGSDILGNGSKSKPWKTLASACTRVAANLGHTIHLNSGVFLETLSSSVPSGVSVEGEGSDKTVLNSNLNDWLIKLYSASFVDGNQFLSNFKIVGNGRKLRHGIYIFRRSNVTVHHVDFEEIQDIGLQISAYGYNQGVTDTAPPAVYLKGIQIYNCTFVNTAHDNYPDDKSSGGALTIGHLEGATIHDNIITENEGYGVKFTVYGWFKGIKVFNNKIRVPNIDQAWEVDMSIELWNIYDDCMVYNNSINTWISLVRGNKGTGSRSVKVYNNDIVFEDLAHTVEGIELASINDVEVYNNYFEKTRYGIAIWRQNSDAPPGTSNILIHNNVFFNNPDGHGILLGGNGTETNNIEIYNNVFDSVKNAISLQTETQTAKILNVKIKNNIMMQCSTGVATMGVGANIADTVIAYNNFFNVRQLFSEWGGVTHSTVIVNNLQVDPQLILTGSRPTPYYKPSMPNSPVVNTGTDVGLPYGNAPYIGAYEYSPRCQAPTNLNLVQ